MSNWNETALFAILMGVALKGTAVLGAAWLTVLALRGRSAAARHLVWTAAAAALLALPVLSVSLPSLPVPGAKTLASEASVLFRTTSTARTDGPASQTAPSISSSSTKPQTTPRWRSHWRLLIMLLWMAGSLSALAQMLLALIRLRGLRNRAGLSPYGDAAAQIAERLGIRHPVDVLESAAGVMPMTFGILRPAVFLPRDASGWTEERRRVVLLHELAHVRRGDVPAQLMTRLALILHWWNPLTWIAWQEFLAERERATDDLVLRAGARASDYAGHLLEITRVLQSGSALGWAAVGMARRSQLEGRLVAILDSRANRKPAGRASAFAAVLAAVALIAPLAAVHAQQDSPPALPADVDATIRAAVAQKNSEMVEKPAAAFSDLGKYDVARQLLDSAVAIHEEVSGAQSADYGLGLLKIGDLERKRNHASEAEAFYTKAVAVLGDREETAPALIYLGILALHKSPDVALGDFQKAQTLDPSVTGAAKMWTALAYEQQDKAADAEAMYRSALAAEAPDSAAAADTCTLLARFLEKQDRADEAKTFSDRAKELRQASSRAANPARFSAIASQTPPPSAPALPATVFRFSAGNGMTQPKVIFKKDPVYSVEGKAAKYAASVLLGVEIDSDGTAQNIQVVKPAGFGLDESAVAAVGQWRFQPGTKDGAPVTVMATIEVNFRLQ